MPELVCNKYVYNKDGCKLPVISIRTDTNVANIAGNDRLVINVARYTKYLEEETRLQYDDIEKFIKGNLDEITYVYKSYNRNGSLGAHEIIFEGYVTNPTIDTSKINIKPKQYVIYLYKKNDTMIKEELNKEQILDLYVGITEVFENQQGGL